MIHLTRKLWAGCIAALCVSGMAGLAAADGAMAKSAYKAARERIELQGKADRKACERQKADARPLCEAQAKGREKVARARLEAQYRPGPDADRAVKEAQADANFELARVRCASGRAGQRKEACLAQARGVREAAVRQAKVEKVQELHALQAARDDRDEQQAEESPNARYRALKAYCLTTGPDRDRCLDEIKRRFNKT